MRRNTSNPANFGPSRPPSPDRRNPPKGVTFIEPDLSGSEDGEHKYPQDPLTAVVQRARALRTLPTVRIGFQVPADVLKKYADALSIALEINPGSPAHTHPILALERRLAIDFIFSSHTKWKDEGTVLDIGASMAQHKGRPFVHGLCPVITPSDCYRNSKYTPGTRYCEHTLENYVDAQCHCTQKICGAISVHSLYYLDVSYLSKFLQLVRVPLFCVIHRFRAIEGAIHEMAYKKEAGRVIAKIDGETYVHDALDWLDSPAGCLPTPNGTIGFHLETKIGHTYVYALFYSPVKGPVVDMSLDMSIGNDSHYGPVNLGKLNSQHATNVASLANEQVDMPVELFSVGTLVEVTTESSKKFVLPKVCFHELLFKVSMMPRTADNFILHVQATKQMLLSYKMSPEARSAAVGPLAVLSFFWNIKEDEATLQSALRKYTTGIWWWSRNTAQAWADTLAFKVRKHVGVKAVLGSATVVIALYLLRRRMSMGSTVMSMSDVIPLKQLEFVIRNTGEYLFELPALPKRILTYVSIMSILEEMAKWAFPGLDHLIVAFETARCVYQYGPAGFILRVPGNIVHYIHRFSKLFGMLAHLGWNWLVLKWAQAIYLNTRLTGPVLSNMPLLVLVVVVAIYWYFRPARIVPNFVMNYNNNRGTPMSPGVHNVSQMHLMSKTVEYKSAPPHAEAQVDILRYVQSGRPILKLAWGVPMFPPVVWSSNSQNEYVGIWRCVGSLEHLDPEPEEVTCLLDHIPNWFDPTHASHRLFGFNHLHIEEKGISDSTFAKWLQKYPVSKRKELLAERVRQASGSVPTSEIKSFVKVEKLMLISGDEYTEKDPRMINATSPAYNTYVGPYIDQVAKRFAADVNPNHPIIKIHVMLDGDYEGLNYFVGIYEDMGAHWVWADVSRMDGNYSPISHASVHVFYKCLGLCAEVLSFISLGTIKRKARTRHGISYVLKSKRASGEPDTSFGNTVMSIIMFCLAVERYLSMGGALERACLFVLGDDVLAALIFCPVKASTAATEAAKFNWCWREIAHLFHFSLTTGYSADLINAEFLSGVFWPVPPQEVVMKNYYPASRPEVTIEYALGVKPGRWMAKSGWIIDPTNSDSRPLQIAHGSVISSMPLTLHVPLVQELVNALLEALSSYRPIFQAEEGKQLGGLQTPESEIKYPPAMLAFRRRYGFSVEQVLDSMKFRDCQPPTFFSSALIDSIVRLDLGDK